MKKSLVCRGCANAVTGTKCTSVDIGINANLELADKFYYLGDMLSVDRDADAAVETRIQIGCNKFRYLVPLLTNKDVSLIVRQGDSTAVVCETACCMEVKPGS